MVPGERLEGEMTKLHRVSRRPGLVRLALLLKLLLAGQSLTIEHVAADGSRTDVCVGATCGSNSQDQDADVTLSGPPYEMRL
jgi:hypothetical protein